MLETPSYCKVCDHRYLVHNWWHPALVAGACLVPQCDCPVFRWSAVRPVHATDAGVEDAVYGRRELRPPGSRRGGRPTEGIPFQGTFCLPEFFLSIGLIIEVQTYRRSN